MPRAFTGFESSDKLLEKVTLAFVKINIKQAFRKN